MWWQRSLGRSCAPREALLRSHRRRCFGRWAAEAGLEFLGSTGEEIHLAAAGFDAQRGERGAWARLARGVQAFAAAPLQHAMVEDLPLRSMIEVLEVRELVHHGVDQGGVLQRTARAHVDQPDADAAVVPAKSVAIRGFGTIGIQVELGKPEALGDPGCVLAQTPDELAILVHLEPTPARLGPSKRQAELRIGSTRHR